MDQLDQFLQRQVDRPMGYSEWIDYGPVKVYLRRTNRLIENERRPVIDLANVGVRANKRGQGHFTAFLEDLIQRMSEDWIYVENVLDARFTAFFLKRGFVADPYQELCFYKRIRP